jgi:hypothetical protein
MFPTDGQTRRAKVRGYAVFDYEQSVRALLPSKYSVIERGSDERGDFLLIEGVDDAGWSMGLYVQPRLASASFTCEELE